jgi:hypothetical protein
LALQIGHQICRQKKPEARFGKKRESSVVAIQKIWFKLPPVTLTYERADLFERFAPFATALQEAVARVLIGTEGLVDFVDDGLFVMHIRL